MDPPFDVEQQLQRHGQALRALAGELVRDPGAADDAVQEVWVSALDRGPRESGSFGGWLRTVLLHVTSKLRRSERRRAHHEALGGARRGDVGGDHVAQLDREETVERLLAAVRGLDEPHRDAIWQRFFEGKTPRDIAAALGVPVATVKSRLHRGLAILRQRLAESAGARAHWRLALVGALGLPEGTATAAVAAITTGGVLMATWTKAVVVAVVLAVTVGWWCQPDVDPGAVEPTSERSAAVGPANVAGRPAAEVARETNGADAERYLAAVDRTAVDAALATIRGRCVDEAGHAVVGKIELHGRTESSRKDAWLRDHEMPQWTDPEPCATDSEGAFVIRFAPPPPFRFWLGIEADGFATRSGLWQSIAPGAVISLGDLVMHPGIEVRGRVVDADGAPCPDAQWLIERQGAAPGADGAIEELAQLGGPCRRDGTFTAGRFAAGDYVAWAFGGGTAPKQDVRLVRERSFVDLVITMARAAGPTIAGRVVDEAGQAVVGAQVGFAKRRLAYSGREGTFVLQRPSGAAASSVSLETFKEGYEGQVAAAVAWGSKDVVVCLQRSPGLCVTVVDEQGEPLPDFAVRCAPIGNTGHFGIGSLDYRVRVRGPFAAGTASVPGVSSGRWKLVLEFPAATHRSTIVQTIEVPLGGLRHVVRTAADTTRSARVVFRDQSPVVGTRVQLIDRFGVRPGPNVQVMGEAAWFDNLVHDGIALVRFEAKTDAEGRVQLRGPADRPLSLRVLGPGHVPVEQEIANLGGEQELLVTCTRGGRLAGRLVPAEAMAELVRLAAPERHHDSPLFPQGARPVLRWVPASGQPTSESFALGDDGAFLGSGLPAGPGALEIEYTSTLPVGVAARGSLVVATAVLVEDQEVRQDADLGALISGELSGTAFWNGAPLANSGLLLRARPGAVNPLQSWATLRTDEQGCFRWRGPAGTYEVLPWLAADGKRLPTPRELSVAVVERGQLTKQTFEFAAGRLAVTLLDSGGRAMEAVTLHAQADPMPATDAKGATSVEVGVGTVTVFVLSKAMQSAEAQQRLIRSATAGSGDPFAAHRVQLGTATVVAGQTTTLELRLPPNWGN